MTKVTRISIVFCLLIQTSIALSARSDTETSYRQDQYPILQQRVPFLKERLLSQNPHIRYRMLGEISAHLPLAEAERMLRQMMKQGDDESIHQQSLMSLISLG